MVKKYIALILAIVLISGCSSGVKETLGMTKVTPDEYTVISNPPLSMPPDFRLRAPEDEDVTFKALNSAKAKSVIAEKNFESYKFKDEKKFSRAEDNFLKAAGISEKKDDIREKILEDSKELTKKEEESTLGKFYYNYLKTKRDPAIDPLEEKKRLEN